MFREIFALILAAVIFFFVLSSPQVRWSTIFLIRAGRWLNKLWSKIIEEIWIMRIDFWYHFCIEGDEFHKSLDLDSRRMVQMSKSQREKYDNLLISRRRVAHEMESMTDKMSKEERREKYRYIIVIWKGKRERKSLEEYYC